MKAILQNYEIVGDSILVLVMQLVLNTFVTTRRTAGRGSYGNQHVIENCQSLRVSYI